MRIGDGSKFSFLIMVMTKNEKNRIVIWAVVNTLAIVILGLLMQTGGAYLVNAAVEYLGNGSASSAAAAAGQYSDYMAAIRSLEPRQIIQAIFVGPLLEELVFRLIFLRAGKMILPFWAANLIQAVLFGLYHTLTIQRIYGFAMGLLIGCVFYFCPAIYRNSSPKSNLKDLSASLLGLMLTFILHMTINVTGLFVTPLLPADISVGAQFAAGSFFMAVAVAVIGVLYYIFKKRTGDINARG